MNYLPTTHVLVMTPRFDAFTVKLIYYPRAAIASFNGPWIGLTAARLLKIGQLLVSTRIYGV